VRKLNLSGNYVVLTSVPAPRRGRAVTLQEQDVHVPPTFLDQYEELEEWRPFAFPYTDHSFHSIPSYSVSTFKQLCSLSVIMVCLPFVADPGGDVADPTLARLEGPYHQRGLH
jgi:hypothetical protein